MDVFGLLAEAILGDRVSQKVLADYCEEKSQPMLAQFFKEYPWFLGTRAANFLEREALRNHWDAAGVAELVGGPEMGYLTIEEIVGCALAQGLNAQVLYEHLSKPMGPECPVMENKVMKLAREIPWRGWNEDNLREVLATQTSKEVDGPMWAILTELVRDCYNFEKSYQWAAGILAQTPEEALPPLREVT